MNSVCFLRSILMSFHEIAGLPAQVGLLLKNRADQKIADNDGNTPLDVAVKTANADIVSL